MCLLNKAKRIPISKLPNTLTINVLQGNVEDGNNFPAKERMTLPNPPPKKIKSSCLSMWIRLNDNSGIGCSIHGRKNTCLKFKMTGHGYHGSIISRIGKFWNMDFPTETSGMIFERSSES